MTVTKNNDCTDDVRVTSYRALISPLLLVEDFPLSAEGQRTVREAREAGAAIIEGGDDRLLVIVGPCSLHDVDAALEYGRLLKQAREQYRDDLEIIMRAYFEKPRTTIGWKGLINDPGLDGSFDINRGLRTARSLLCELNGMGMAVGCEMLDTISPQFINDLVSWGAIGARTTECQLHRELASGCSFPVGFKNGTGGDIQIAIDALRATSAPHHFLGVNKHGLASICSTRGNESCHMILRGGRDPNYEREHVQNAISKMISAKLSPTPVMIDCSHGNSRKCHTNQPIVCSDVASQVAEGERSIIGVMIESNLVEGNQKLGPEGPSGLVFGKSITDACVSWDNTVPMLDELSKAVQQRRLVSRERSPATVERDGRMGRQAQCHAALFDKMRRINIKKPTFSAAAFMTGTEVFKQSLRVC